MQRNNLVHCSSFYLLVFFQYFYVFFKWKLLVLSEESNTFLTESEKVIDDLEDGKS